MDIEDADPGFFGDNSSCDCWIFGDTLEHLRDPWALLEKIRAFIPANGNVVACIPNAQHWSIQRKLCCGMLQYEESGLLDKTHLRWFTRKTIIEMFHSAGFAIEEGISRTFQEPEREKFLDAIRAMAILAGADPEIAVSDALPLQYVVRATPV